MQAAMEIFGFRPKHLPGLNQSSFWLRHHHRVNRRNCCYLKHDPHPPRQVCTSVSVLNETDINAYGNASVSEVLRQMPGMATSNAGGAGKATSLRIRGEEGFRTLIIFDGMRLSDPASTQVGAQLEHLMSDGISRIEVLRGPQGLAYGADAGGVVNISSHPSGSGFFINLDTQAGDLGTKRFSGNIGGGNEKVDYFLSLSDFDTDGYNTRQSDTVLHDDDGYRNTTSHGRIGFALTDNLRMNLVHREVDGDSQFDNCFSSTTIHDCVSEYEFEGNRIALDYDSENYGHTLSYSDTKIDRENFALGVSSFTAKGELKRWEYLGNMKNLPGFELVFGIDHEEAILNGNARDNDGFYLEYLSGFSDNFFITGGLRYDDNEDFGTNTSHRVGTAYLIDLDNSATLKFKGSVGTGFRAPSPFEIAYNAGASAFPPASLVTLDHEESKGYELGVEYVLGHRLHLEAVYFDQEVKDAIFFDLANYSGYLQDTGTSTSTGIELTANFQINKNLQLKLTTLTTTQLGQTANSVVAQKIWQISELNTVG